MLNETSPHQSTGIIKDGVLIIIDGVCKDSTLYCVTITSISFLLLITGIILNSLVCHVMIKSKRYNKSISCFFITHLAVVEIVYRVAVTPSMIFLSIPTRVTPSSIPCKLNYFISSSCHAAIFGSLVVIAVDRYRNIVYPLGSMKQGKRRPIKLSVSLVWLYAFACSVMFLYTANQVPISQLPEGKVFTKLNNITS